MSCEALNNPANLPSPLTIWRLSRMRPDQTGLDWSRHIAITNQRLPSLMNRDSIEVTSGSGPSSGRTVTTSVPNMTDLGANLPFPGDDGNRLEFRDLWEMGGWAENKI